jgi:periplasmic protein TonB
MKRIFYPAAMLLFICKTTLCQNSAKQNNAVFIPPDTAIIAPNPPVNNVYTYVEIMPKYKGGQDSLNKYIATHLTYPKKAQESNISGRVLVRFVVNADGKVSNVEIVRGIAYGCDEEAKRVIENMPDWIPGMQNHKNVRVYMTLPINFKLQ